MVDVVIACLGAIGILWAGLALFWLRDKWDAMANTSINEYNRHCDLAAVSGAELAHVQAHVRAARHHWVKFNRCRRKVRVLTLGLRGRNSDYPI